MNVTSWNVLKRYRTKICGKDHGKICFIVQYSPRVLPFKKIIPINFLKFKAKKDPGWFLWPMGLLRIFANPKRPNAERDPELGGHTAKHRRASEWRARHSIYHCSWVSPWVTAPNFIAASLCFYQDFLTSKNYIFNVARFQSNSHESY